MKRSHVTVRPSYDLPVRWDIPCRTNSDYTEELSFQHGGDYLDITGLSHEIQIRTSPTSPNILKTLSTVYTQSAEGIYPVEPSRGFVQIRLSRSSALSLFNGQYPEYKVGDNVKLYYDWLVTMINGDKEAWLMGYFILSKGVTNG